ncbi:MAG: hypothetical protein E5W20_00275, partial [Mesorhizobium sp.]
MAGALRYLKKSTSGAPIMGRPLVIPYPDDAELIRDYRAASTKEYLAAPATGRNPDTVGGYTNFLRHFSQYLRQNNKPGIAARIHDKSLDKDVESFKAVSYGNRLSIGSALAHLRDILPRIVLGRETVLAAHPADAVTRRVGAAAEAGILQSIYNQNNATADFLFLPVNNGTATSPGTHWSLLLVDRRDPERRFAYHYDSLQREGYNDVPAKQLAGLLN